MGEIYSDFAYIYDKLMGNELYSNIVEYIKAVFDKHNIEPSLILDLGCGTGNVSVQLAKQGYDMIGIDFSEDMLCVAREKAVENDLEILFLNQDMRSFELYGTVDAVLLLVDSLNYITSEEEVRDIFALVHNYLNPDGIFIFDINTVYKLSEMLPSASYTEVHDDIAYIWDSFYGEKDRICEFDLTFFVKDNIGNKYNRHDEQHHQKAWETEELEKMLISQNIKVLGIYDGYSFDKVCKTSERAVFICKK